MQLPPDILKACVFLAGPTACGKSEVAIEIARRIDAEIVSMDSMSLYRGMDVGTAKPTTAQRAFVPHHLIDILEPDEEFSVAEYLAAADAAVRAIFDRGRRPLFVGGTGLYLRSLLRGVFDGPGRDQALRQSLESEAARLPEGVLYERLRQVDVASTRIIHPRDVRRIIRALEVHALTGRSLSELQRQQALDPVERPHCVFWLAPPRAWLYERIERRVERMIEEGLVGETRRLAAGERPMSRTARQALGYKEVIAHLDGLATLEQTIAMIQTRTRQFAKRQHTWFRNLEECKPVSISGDESQDQIADRILSECRGALSV